MLHYIELNMTLLVCVAKAEHIVRTVKVQRTFNTGFDESGKQNRRERRSNAERRRRGSCKRSRNRRARKHSKETIGHRRARRVAARQCDEACFVALFGAIPGRAVVAA